MTQDSIIFAENKEEPDHAHVSRKFTRTASASELNAMGNNGQTTNQNAG